MATCSIIQRNLKDGDVYTINNELLSWAVSYQEEKAGLYNIERPLYVDTMPLWKAIEDKLGPIEDHPLRYYRFLPLYQRKDISRLSFGSLYEEGKVSRFMADAFGVGVVNPINLPVVGTSSTIGNTLITLGSSAKPVDRKQFDALFTDDTLGRVSDMQRVMSYFRNYNAYLSEDEVVMEEIRKTMTEPSFYELSQQEPYYPYLLYEHTGITPSQYEDLLVLIDAMDVFNVGREGSIYRITDESLSRIEQHILRFSSIDTATMLYVEALYDVLKEEQQDMLIELVSSGEAMSVKGIMSRLGMDRSHLLEAVHRLVRGVGFFYPGLFWDTFYVESLDTDKILGYVPVLASLLEGNTDDAMILNHMVLETPFALAYYDYKGALLLSEIEGGTDSIETYMDYLSILLSNVKDVDAALAGLSPMSSDRSNTYEQIRNAFHHDNLESIGSRMSDLLRHFYMGRYGEQPKSLDEFSFGRCQG